MITCGHRQPDGYMWVYVGHLPAGEKATPDPLVAYPKIHLKLRPCNFYMVPIPFAI
jgi:hypothetical protein